MEVDPSQLLEILKFRTSAPCGIIERNPSPAISATTNAHRLITSRITCWSIEYRGQKPIKSRCGGIFNGLDSLAFGVYNLPDTGMTPGTLNP